MKIALIIGIAVSSLLVLLGAMFKIQSWEGGEYFLLAGLFGEVVCITGLVIQSITSNKEKPDSVMELDPDKVSSRVKEELRRDNDQYV